MEIPPKTVTKRYKNHQIKAVFDKDSKTWTWMVTKTITVNLDGVADTQEAALADAREVIDKIVEQL
jgi:predicted RNase H-like HicB family nuclease